MSNTTTMYNIQTMAPYLGDGVHAAINALLKNIPPGERLSDGLSLFASSALTTTAVAVKASAGKVHGVVIQSKGALGYLSLWNVAQGSVTVGTTSQQAAFPFTATSGQISSFYCGGSGNGTAPLWSTAITAAVATTVIGNGAVGTLPVTFILYS